MLEIMIGLAVLSAVGFYCYRSGKQIGSRKGFGAGRYDKKCAKELAGRLRAAGWLFLFSYSSNNT